MILQWTANLAELLTLWQIWWRWIRLLSNEGWDLKRLLQVQSFLSAAPGSKPDWDVIAIPFLWLQYLRRSKPEVKLALGVINALSSLCGLIYTAVTTGHVEIPDLDLNHLVQVLLAVWPCQCRDQSGQVAWVLLSILVCFATYTELQCCCGYADGSTWANHLKSSAGVSIWGAALCCMFNIY